MKPRPKETDPEIIEAAAVAEHKRLRKIFPDSGPEDFDLIKASLMNPYQNGYVRAKEWERAGWDPDLRLVEFLDDLDAGRELAEAIKRWVAAEGIVCPYPLGAAVSVRYRGRSVAGEIVRIDADEGRCLVCCETLGHVRQGAGTHGILVSFESLAPPEQVANV